MNIMNNTLKDKILVSVWGYSMVMVDFWKVIKETKDTIVVRQLKDKIVENTGYLQGTCMPIEEFETEKDWKTEVKEGEPRPMKFVERRLYKDGEKWFSRKNGFYKSFEMWNGKPIGFDHCD